MSFRIDPRQPLTSEVRRIATGEVNAMLRHLAAADRKPDRSLHDCRKRIKRMRALLRLVRSGSRAFTEAETHRYRDISVSLSGPRKAAALVETVDRIVADFPRETGGGALDPVRRTLTARRESVEKGHGLAILIDAAAVSCQAGLAQIDRLDLPQTPVEAADVLACGARKAMRRVRKAWRKAAKRGTADDFHDLRKAVKAHAMHLRLLKALWPAPIRARQKAVEALGEKLGDLHDIVVLRAMIDDEKRPLGGRSETKLLVRLLNRSERKLRKLCLAEAARLFSDGPKSPTRKLASRARASLGDISRPPVKDRPSQSGTG